MRGESWEVGYKRGTRIGTRWGRASPGSRWSMAGVGSGAGAVMDCSRVLHKSGHSYP